MNTCTRITLTVLGIVSLLTVAAHAQVPEQRPARMQDDAVAFEAVHRSMRGDSSTVDIMFRFRHDFFVFARAAGSPSYTAAAEVSIEILDSTESSVSRHIESFTLTSIDNAMTSLRTRYWQGVATFRLPRGRFMALCTVTDRESEKKQVQQRLPLVMPRPHTASSSLILARSFDSAAGLVPCNLGGAAFFGADLYVAAELPQAPPSNSAVYSLTRTINEGEDRLPYQRDTSVRLTVFPNRRLVPVVDSMRSLVYRLTPDPSGAVCILPLNGTTLPQGRFELTLRLSGADTSRLRSAFALRWIDMPQSLRDLDFAAAAMKHITTDDDLDMLTSGRRAARIQAFENFWKTQDPTPGTAYNERLAEYFRRVDYAFTAYRTLKEENGIFTDRGKIHILYGSPSSKERPFSPGAAPREVWRYASLGKVFTFEDSSRQGNYKLIHTDTQ